MLVTTKTIRQRIALFLAAIMVFTVAILPAAFTAFADDKTSVSDVVQEIYEETEEQAKSIADNTVFPAMRTISAIIFIAMAIYTFIRYHGQQKLSWVSLVVAGVALLIAIIGPKYIWDLIS